MAIKPARFSLQLTDKRGGGGTFLVHAAVDDGSTLVGVNLALATLATAFSTVSTAGIKAGEFTLVNKAIATDPGSDADIAAGAVFDFSNAALTPRTYGQNVPSFLDSLIESNGTIDITATVQAAFVTSMLAAVLGGTYTDSEYLDLVEGLDAFLSNRKRRRRLRP
jgi:hypothetical protein